MNYEQLRRGLQTHRAEAAMHISEIDPLPHFIGPVSMSIMEDPVITSNGMTYERSQIVRWFSLTNPHTGRRNITDPMTNVVLANRDLIPNFALKNAIVEWNAMKDVFIENKHCCDKYKSTHNRDYQTIHEYWSIIQGLIRQEREQWKQRKQ